MTFGERLKALRHARNMTQADLAGDQLSVSYISLLESNRRQPTRATIDLLAQALGCEPAVLHGADDGTKPTPLALRHADLHFQTGNVESARDGYQRALTAGIEDPMQRLRAMVGLASALQREGRLAEAIEIFEGCVRSGISDPAHSVSLAAAQGWCRCLYELGELYRAIEVGNRTLEELARMGAEDSEQSIQLLSTVAAAWFELGELRQAENLLAEGMARAERVKSPIARGAILWNASAVAAESGKYLEALELADEALAAYRHGPNPIAPALLMTNRGGFLRRLDPPRFAEALDVLDKALAILSGADNTVYEAAAWSELSHVHLAMGDTQAAISAAEKARVLLTPAVRLEYGKATIALAAAISRTENPARARQLFIEAATSLAALGASRTAAKAWVELATTLVEQGELAQAVSAFTEAAALLHLLPSQPGSERSLAGGERQAERNDPAGAAPGQAGAGPA